MLMTNTEILTKAIQKAIDGGWDKPRFVDVMLSYPPNRGDITKVAPQVIFNHDFAKALWGENDYVDRNNIDLSDFADGVTNDMSWTSKDSSTATLDGDYYYRELPAWQYHLQQMVIAQDPIKYLEEH